MKFRIKKQLLTASGINNFSLYRLAGYVTFILLLVGTTSCIWGAGEEVSRYRTKGGKLVYDQTANALISYLDVFIQAQNISLYLFTEDKNEKERIKRYLFSDYTISESGNSCSLTKDKCWIFYSDGAPVDQPGSNWTIMANLIDNEANNNSNRLIKTYSIACISPNEWEISIEEYNVSSFSGNAELKVVLLDKKPNKPYLNSYYSITGNGTIVYNEQNKYLNISYEIETPFINKLGRNLSIRMVVIDHNYAPQGFLPNYFEEGSLTMTTTNSSSSVPEPVKAELIMKEKINVQITFKGVTELWYETSYGGWMTQRNE